MTRRATPNACRLAAKEPRRPALWPAAPRAFLVAALIATSATAFALPSDRDKPIEIRAAHVEIDDAQGVAVYTGDVRMTQGTLRVTAERLTIHIENDNLVRMTAEGNGGLAHYRQLPEPDGAPVQADARTITYFTRDQRVQLEGNASLQQAAEAFTGSVISYDIRARQVRARSGSGAPVRMIIQPERVRSEPASDSVSERAPGAPAEGGARPSDG